MLITDLVKHFGSQYKVAKALKIVPTTTTKWLKNGDHVPVNVALLVEALTGGAVPFDKEHYQAELLAKHKAKQ